KSRHSELRPLMTSEMNHVVYAEPGIEAMEMAGTFVYAWRGGTDEMRVEGQKYLRKRSMESDKDYKDRLEQATLYPAFTDSVAAMVGRLFTKPIKIGEEVPQGIRDLLQDVDTEDRNLHAFARDWLDDAISYGISHVLVDMPRNEARTRADEKQLGIRPYAVLVKHNQILGWRSEKVGGNEVLTQVRIKESAQVDDGRYGTKTVERI